jgi:outer membrane protein TolC
LDKDRLPWRLKENDVLSRTLVGGCGSANDDLYNPRPKDTEIVRMASIKVKLAAYAVVGLMVGGCATPEERPFDPRGLGDIQRLGAAEPRSQAPMNNLPTTLESPYASNQPLGTVPQRPQVAPFDQLQQAVRLPLREIVQRAVINNLDIRVAGYDPGIEQSRVIEAEARFDPTVFAEMNFDYRDVDTAGQTTSFLGGATFEQLTRNFTARTGIRQLTPSGGQVELRYQTSRNDVTPTFSSINPFWETELVLAVTQPLLRDFGNDINRARIVINRFNRQISVLEFRRTVEETLLTLEQRYWELSQAMAEVQIAEELLERTIDTADILFKRRGQDVTSVQINQSIASIRSRSALLIDARRRVQDLSDQIKRIMNDPDLPVTSPVLVLPETSPLVEPIRLDLEDAIESALLARLELGQQQLRVESASTALAVAKNNLMPQLNLVATAGVQGLDDTWGWSNADAVDGDQNFTVGVGLQFEFPIGNRAARAIYVRASLQRQQAIDSYANLINQVALDVKTTLRDVETSWELMIQQQQNRFAANEALAGLELRERNNEPLTPNFVDLKLNLQAALAEAKRQESAAISAYNIAIARFELAKGTLLKYNNVMLDEAERPMGR